LGGYLPLIWQPADTQINLIWIGSAAPVPKQDRRHNGGTARGYQEISAPAAAYQPWYRLMCCRSICMFMHRWLHGRFKIGNVVDGG
jgi:hypothetical protein